MAEKSRAAQLRDELDARQAISRHPESGRPLRKKVRLSYLDGKEIDVPFWSGGDMFKAEKRFEKPLALILAEASGEMFLSYCALHRHFDEGERPTQPFEKWVETVDQIWDAGEEEPDPKA